MVRGGENIPPVGPATLLTRKRRGTRHFLMVVRFGVPPARTAFFWHGANDSPSAPESLTPTMHAP